MKRLIATLIGLGVIVAAAFYFGSCATIRLERSLKPDIKDWYEQHWIIMEYPMPKSMGKGSERGYFLRLSETLQRKYIENFWEIRDVEAEDNFNQRMKVVKFWFRGGPFDPWNTDLGRIMLLCGQPFDEQFRDEMGVPYTEGSEQWQTEDRIGVYTYKKGFFRHWLYWWGSGFFQQIITLTFRWDFTSLDWHYAESTDSLTRSFIDWCRWKMAPTEDGWKLWQEIAR